MESIPAESLPHKNKPACAIFLGMSPEAENQKPSEIEPLPELAETIPGGASEPVVIDDQSQPPTPQEDLKALLGLGIPGALLLRFRSGKHPDSRIEALLARRLDLNGEEFLGPFLIRALGTLALVIGFCSVAWLILWFFCTLAGFTAVLLEISLGMSLLVVSVGVIGMIFPIRLYDEAALEKAAREKIAAFEKEVAGLPPDNASET